MNATLHVRARPPLILFVLVCCGSASAAVPPGYIITDLGEVDITGGGAKDINESGQIAVNLDGIAFVYDHGVTFPPGGYSTTIRHLPSTIPLI